MKTKAAVLRGVGQDFEITELDLDPPKAGEVLIRYVAAGLCHSDEHLRHGDILPRFPIVGGHEGAGIIESDLLFVSPMTGRHFHASPIGQDYIRPAGCCLVDCPNCGAVAGEWCKTDFPVPNGKRLPLHDERWDAAGKYGSIGWHTFRHTYRSWLDETGAPMGVQQKLMRHAQISTTMNVYGNALMEAKREANAAVVNRILRSA